MIIVKCANIKESYLLEQATVHHQIFVKSSRSGTPYVFKITKHRFVALNPKSIINNQEKSSYRIITYQDHW